MNILRAHWHTEDTTVPIIVGHNKYFQYNREKNNRQVGGRQNRKKKSEKGNETLKNR